MMTDSYYTITQGLRLCLLRLIDLYRTLTHTFMAMLRLYYYDSWFRIRVLYCTASEYPYGSPLAYKCTNVSGRALQLDLLRIVLSLRGLRDFVSKALFSAISTHDC